MPDQSKLVALLDAFAEAAPRNASLTLHGDEEASVLIEWSMESSLGADVALYERNGWRWRAVHVVTRNGAHVTAHRDGEQVEQAVEHG